MATYIDKLNVNGTEYTLALTPSKGSSTVPVYFNSNGLPVTCDLSGTYLAKNPGYIEMMPGSSAAHGGYIDFHYNSSSADYTSRIIESGSGTLNINGSTFTTTGVAMTPGNVTMTNGNLNISRRTTIAANEAARINFTIT